MHRRKTSRMDVDEMDMDLSYFTVTFVITHWTFVASCAILLTSELEFGGRAIMLLFATGSFAGVVAYASVAKRIAVFETTCEGKTCGKETYSYGRISMSYIVRMSLFAMCLVPIVWLDRLDSRQCCLWMMMSMASLLSVIFERSACIRRGMREHMAFVLYELALVQKEYAVNRNRIERIRETWRIIELRRLESETRRLLSERNRMERIHETMDYRMVDQMCYRDVVNDMLAKAALV